MRQTDLISQAKPAGTMALTFEARTILIVNGTVSAILFRQGGSDVPTKDSADFIVPPQSIHQIPAFGVLFSYGFQDASLLPEGDIRAAKITALDSSETVGLLGSTSTLQRQEYWEKERNPKQVQIQSSFTLVGAVGGGAVSVTPYTVPLLRKARISAGQIELSVNSMAAPGDFVSVSAAGPNAPIIILKIFATAVNQNFNRLMGFELILNPGESVVVTAFCGTNAGNIYAIDCNLVATEFDF